MGRGIDQAIYKTQPDAGPVMAPTATVRALVPGLDRGQAPMSSHVLFADAKGKISNNTGYGATATVGREECTCCGICADVCPERAIAVFDVAEVDPEKCTGCGLCVEECPNNAIILLRLEKAL